MASVSIYILAFAQTQAQFGRGVVESLQNFTNIVMPIKFIGSGLVPAYLRSSYKSGIQK